jgi:hypothetical protein
MEISQKIMMEQQKLINDLKKKEAQMKLDAASSVDALKQSVLVQCGYE